MEHDPGVNSGEEAPTMWAISDNPKRDERVVWLIDQVGGQQALKHRYEDIRRRLHGERGEAMGIGKCSCKRSTWKA